MKRINRLCVAAFAAVMMGVESPCAAPTEVADGVYLAPGISNSYLVVTPAGNVVIDTGALNTAKRQFESLRAADDGPVKFIILTHAHLDHAGGMDLWRSRETEVIAHRQYKDELEYQERLHGFFLRRNAAQFGLPVSKSPSQPNGSSTDRSVDIFFDETFEFTLGGLTFQLVHTPGETSDHISVRILELGIVFVGDNYYDSFPNLYTLRGTKPRWALDYVNSLNAVISWQPNLVLAGHVAPLQGKDLVNRNLIRYRDAIQYVHDKTVYGMNNGKGVFALMQEISLPERLDVGQKYGSVAWSVRGIYEGYVGWFDEKPESIYSVPRETVYPDLVDLAGGPDRVAALAKEKLVDGNLVEGLYLTSAALWVDSKHRAALETRIRLLEALEDGAGNFNERAWLRHARKLSEGKLAED